MALLAEIQMSTNLEKYKNDLNKLIRNGDMLHAAMQYECYGSEFKKIHIKELGEDETKNVIKSLPAFSATYQEWYSEVKAVIKQLLPDRLDDLIRHYQKPNHRRDISYENYRIEDYLQGLNITRGSGPDKRTVVDPSAAIPHFQQQLAMLKAASSRFESTLYDIRQMVQADLFDTELDSASELAKNGFLRGAGAMAGVVLEKHLGDVCSKHNIKSRKKHPTISEFNDLLKADSVIDVPTWRQIQRLGDLRNLCDHGKDRDPTKDEIDELISGTEKITHTIF